MLKRIRWMVLGAIAWVTFSVWARDKIRQIPARAVDAAAEKGTELAQTAAERGRHLRSRLREALSEGATAMRARDGELRRAIAEDNGKPA